MAAVVAALALSFASPVRAQEPAAERAVVTIASAIGGRTEAEATALLARAEALIAACRAEGRAAGLEDEARVRLSIDVRGRVTTSVLVEGTVPAAQRGWHRCVTRQLARLRFARGGAGAVEVVVVWSEPGEAQAALRALMGEDGTQRFGVGGLGARGTGPGGGGTGDGTIGLGTLGGFERGGPGGPRVRTGAPAIEGPLSAEVIRRVIRRHINEVRYCYSQALLRDPRRAGRTTLAFVVARDGAVSEATVGDDTVGDDEMIGCLTTALRRWTFPAPAGGARVRVTYPFVFDVRPPPPAPSTSD